MAKVMDMTCGSPFKKLLIFSIPIAIGFMLQNLYSLGDTLIVSLALGADQVTGINVSGSLTFMVLGTGQGLAAGFGVVLSQFVGAKDQTNMRKSVATSIFLTAMISLILTVFSVTFAKSILTLMKTDEAFLEHSVSYTRAIFAGITFTLFYNLSDQIMRAMGDSKTPLYILIFCAILNVGLNSLLFLNKGLGVAWAGWATIISQGVSAVIGFTVIFTRHKQLRPQKSYFLPKFKFALKHLTVGIPMALQFTITAFSCIIQQSAFNSLDNNFYAMGQGSDNKIDNLFSSILVGCGNAMAVYCGQNYGAKRIDRIKLGAKQVLGVGAIYSAIAMTLSISLCKPISRILLPGVDHMVYEYAFRYMISQAPFYFFLFILLAFRQGAQAMNRSFEAMFGGFVELATRCFAAFVLAKNFGFAGACFSNSLAWFGTSVFFATLFIFIIRSVEKKQQQENAILNSELAV